jgi:hypothetical protein
MKLKDDEIQKSLSEMSRTEIRKTLKNELFKGVSKAPLTPEKFKRYVSQLFYIDDIQTTFQNQNRSEIVNQLIKYDATYPEICRLRRIENDDNGDKDKKDSTKAKVALLIKEALVREINLKFEKNGDNTRVKINATKAEILTGKIKDVEDYINDLSTREYNEDVCAQIFELFETDRLKDVETYLKTIPVYAWCKEVRGLGTKLSAKLIAGIGDIQRFPNPASLWSYCGVGDATKEKRVTGQQLKHSPKMRATLFNVGECFIKAGSQYRIVYDKRKEKTLITHPEWHNLVPCPIKNVNSKAPKIDEKGKMVWANQHPKHAHIDATRVMIKRFLAELFVAWYQSLGIEPPAKPYGVEIQGHHEDPMIVPYVGKRHIIELEDFHVGDKSYLGDVEGIELTEHTDNILYLGDVVDIE